MVSQTVNATYTETYDINTVVNELSLIAIHTPQAPSLKKMFKGFFTNYKKFKILGCNVQMVCASKQELTPDLIGLSAGQVDPRDVLNPILFKACTGENLNVLLNQIYNASDTNVVASGSIEQHRDSRTKALNAYYAMLADDTWRKAHPQAGITINGLRPMVHKVVTTQPFKYANAAYSGYQTPQISSHDTQTTSSESAMGFGGPSGSNSGNDKANPTIFVSNGITEMPWMDTTFQQSTEFLTNGSSLAKTSMLANWYITNVPRVFMGCLVLPPAILQSLFFRMRISWFVQFREFRPAIEVGPIDDNYGHVSTNGNEEYSMLPYSSLYANLYHTAAAKELPNEASSFDTTAETEVELVNERAQ